MKKAYEAHIRRLCQAFRTAYFIGEYQMDLNFEYKECDPDKHSLVCDDGRIVIAEISVDPTYLNFSITFFNDLYERFKKGHSFFVANMVAHELAHVITEPLFKLAKEHMSPANERAILQTNERQTQRIANILMQHISREEWVIKKEKKKQKRRKR